MSTTSYVLGTFQATTGFTTDSAGKLSDGVTSTGNGYESTGGTTAGSTAAVTALVDLGSSPPSVTSVFIAPAWEGTPNVILDYANSLSGPWTTANTVTSPTGGGTRASHTYNVTISPSVTARYWRLSVQDTSAGGGGA